MEITKEQVMNILYVLDNEYQDVLTGNATRDKLKIDTWYAKLKQFSYKDCQYAVSRLLDNKVYGKPNISDLMEILKPELKNQNLGAEFAQRLVDLASRYGADNIAERITDEFGNVGYSIYEQVKRELRVLLVDDEATFKAQIRNLFNSYNERYAINPNIALPYSFEKGKLSRMKYTPIETNTPPRTEEEQKQIEILLGLTEED